MVLLTIGILLMFLNAVIARDAFTISFIKSYIENEMKPTHLIYNLCWEKSLEVKLVKEVAKSGISSSSVLKIAEHHSHEVLFLLDLSCPDAESTISNATSRNLLRSPYRWLVLSLTKYDDDNNDNAIPSSNSEQMHPSIMEFGKFSYFRNSPLLSDSDFIVVEMKSSGYYVFTEIHRSAPTGPLIYNVRGFYNGTFVDSRPHRELFVRRKNLMGYPITMSNVIQDSNRTEYHMLKEDRLEPENDAPTKLCWSNARLAFEMLNATPRHIFTHRWGFKQNGSWSGMIDDIHSERADLGSNCIINDERLAIVVFTDRIASFRIRFIFRQPPLSYVANIFYLPFSTHVWLALIGCVALSIGFLYLASKWESYFEKSPAILGGTVGDALLLGMSAVSQQGCVMEPKKASGRITVWVLFSSSMALYAAYSANVVVLLQTPSSSIKSLSQLEHSKMTLAANDVDYNHFIFSQYKDPVRVEIYKKVDPPTRKKQFYSLTEGVERIRQGLFAFHTTVAPVYRRIEDTFLETEKCDLMEINFMNEFDPFLPVKKGSPYLELLRVSFKRIREHGIQDALKKRLQVPKPKCDKGAAFSSVGFQDLRYVMALMLYGIAASIAIACGEIAVFKMLVETKRVCTSESNNILPRLL